MPINYRKHRWSAFVTGLGALVIIVILYIFINPIRSDPADNNARSDPEVNPHPISFEFDGSISENALNSYLSHAITQSEFTSQQSDEDFREDLRMILNIGAKFVGRSAFEWAMSGNDEAHFRRVAERAAEVHEADPEIILQAGVFETAYENIEKIPIPGWVFEEFGLKPEQRNFDYESMLFADGRFVDHWVPGGSVPDITSLETRMWYFYRAARYIDSGYEAIHMGQIELVGLNDPFNSYWYELFQRIRDYAKVHARRHMILLDAHTHGIVKNNKLLLDFHSFPLRPVNMVNKPQAVELQVGYKDSIYKDSKGGITPSGWETDSLPYLVELDNYSGITGEPDVGVEGACCWGYDEIAWFAKQPEEYRNEWLRYAWNFVRENDPAGWVQFPGRRTLGSAPLEIDQYGGAGIIKTWLYRANTKSETCKIGFNQEETMKAIWNE